MRIFYRKYFRIAIFQVKMKIFYRKYFRIGIFQIKKEQIFSWLTPA